MRNRGTPNAIADRCPTVTERRRRRSDPPANQASWGREARHRSISGLQPAKAGQSENNGTSSLPRVTVRHVSVAALPAWPLPRVTRLADASELSAWLAGEDGTPPSHLACIVEDPSSLTRDPGPIRIALCRAHSGAVWTPEDPQRPQVAVIECADAKPLAVLGALWVAGQDTTAPYVVFDDAQLALQRLGPEVPAPARLACIKTAALLLGESTHSGRVDALVSRRLERELLSPMASLESVAPTQASALLPLMRVFAHALRAQQSVRLFELECALVPAVVAMERVGFFFDTTAFERLVHGWHAERGALAKPAAGDATTEVDPDPETVARRARLDKLLSTYAHWGTEFADADGRIHCTLSPMATESGRFACSRPNLQQVPSQHTAPGFRDCFRAPPGHLLIVADYAQIELRVAAQLAPDEHMRQLFREGRDPHRAMAAAMTGKPEAEVTGHDRKLAKAINFGFLFGMGATRFAQYAESSYGLSLSLEQAQAAKEDFHRMFPGIAAWHEQTKRLSKSRHEVVVRTATGRVKRFPPQQVSFSAALNIPVQGTAAEGFKYALIELHRELPSLRARGILCVHDEFIAEAPQDAASAARDVVVRCMERGMARVLPDVPVAVEARIAQSWGDESAP